MIILSNILDFAISLTLKNEVYRRNIYRKALDCELRKNKLGRIVLRNLNTMMSKNLIYHEEVKKWFSIVDYQKSFWESDFGLLWYEGNLNAKNVYFDEAVNDCILFKYKTHLDIGCGWGGLSNQIANCKSVLESKGIDISEKLISKANSLNTSSIVTFQLIDFINLDENEKYDLVTLIGATDYIEPALIEIFLKKMIKQCNKEIIIMNSLRGIKFEQVMEIKESIQTWRYDEGYVHPINLLLLKLSKEYPINYKIEKLGTDSTLTKIFIQNP